MGFYSGSTACYQHCSINGITMCVQNQWAFLKVEILNGFKWSISRRVDPLMYSAFAIELSDLSKPFKFARLKGFERLGNCLTKGTYERF